MQSPASPLRLPPSRLAGAGEKLRPRDLLPRKSQVEEHRSLVLSRVQGRLVQYRTGVRNQDVVQTRGPEMGKSHAPAGSAPTRELPAGRAAMQVYADGKGTGAEDPDDSESRRYLAPPEPSPGVRISSTAGFPSNSSRNRDSTMTDRRRSGRQSFNKRRAGVNRMISPIDRSRMMRMRAPGGRSGRRRAAFMGFSILDFRFWIVNLSIQSHSLLMHGSKI